MPKIKNILIFSAIAIVFAVIFYIFFLKSSSGGGALMVTSPEETTPADGGMPNSFDYTGDKTIVAKDFLTLLLNVRNIKLNDSLLNDPAFANLRDSSIVLVPDGNEGRPNPFAKLGNDIMPVAPAVPSAVSPDTSGTPINPISPTNEVQ